MPTRILLVDDDSNIAEGIRLRRNASGYDCLVVGDGSIGLSSAEAFQPRAILLDIRLPKLDGITLLRSLNERQGTKMIPVIVVSASLVEQNNALDSGARFFLSKPYDGTPLLQAIQYASDESHNLCELGTQLTSV